MFNRDFQVYVRQYELFSADSYNIAEIYKIHGSALDAESVIVGIDNLDKIDLSAKPINRLLPVYKYVKKRDISKDTKLYDYIQAHNSMEKIISNTVLKSIKNTPQFETYVQLVQYMDPMDNCRKTAMAILKNMDKLSIDELGLACKYLYEKYPDEYATETNAKRCIMCLDFRENY